MTSLDPYPYGPRSIFVYSSKSSIFEECSIVFQVLVYKQMLSFFEECINDRFPSPSSISKKIKMSRILLSIHLNFGCSSYQNHNNNSNNDNNHNQNHNHNHNQQPATNNIKQQTSNNKKQQITNNKSKSKSKNKHKKKKNNNKDNNNTKSQNQNKNKNNNKNTSWSSWSWSSSSSPSSTWSPWGSNFGDEGILMMRMMEQEWWSDCDAWMFWNRCYWWHGMRTNPRIYLEMTSFIFFWWGRGHTIRISRRPIMGISLWILKTIITVYKKCPQGLSMLERSFQHDPARNNARDTFWRVIYKASESHLASSSHIIPLSKDW